MADLIVRNMQLSDIDEIVELEKLCFATPWSRESLLYDATENHMSAYIVAELEGHVVGYVGIWVILDEGHINNVAVSPEYRRLQIGSRLIDTMIKATQAEGVKSHTLEVRAGNEPAKKLYAKFGFKEAGVRKGYYEDNGEDAIIMWRE